jgi:chemotaxis protein methyltransferase WspC
MSFCCTKTNLSGVASPPPLRGNGILPPRSPKALPAKPVQPQTPAAVPEVEEPARSDLEKAQSLADAGKLDEALTVLGTALQSDSENAEIHFLQGVIEEARGGNREAETHYRRTLFLDPSHAGALQHMTLLLRSEGRNRAADNLSRRASRHSS